MSEKFIYILSPVRNVTPEQESVINGYVGGLKSEGKFVFNPKEDAPQGDETGFNIVMAELNFMHLASSALEGGRIDILWNAGRVISEGSLVDLGIAEALGLPFNLVTIFNENETSDKQLGLEIIKEELTDSDYAPIFEIIDEMITEIQNSSEITIDWNVGISSEEDQWQRVYLGLALGCMAQNPDLKIKLGKLVGDDPEGKKSYPKVIREIERMQSEQ